MFCNFLVPLAVHFFVIQESFETLTLSLLPRWIFNRSCFGFFVVWFYFHLGIAESILGHVYLSFVNCELQNVTLQANSL